MTVVSVVEITLLALTVQVYLMVVQWLMTAVYVLVIIHLTQVRVIVQEYQMGMLN